MPDPRDTMLREMAGHRGFRLVKSRRRKPGGDFGRYGLVDAKTGKSCFGVGAAGLEASADDIETFLRGRAAADWKRSISQPGARPKKPASRTSAARLQRATSAGRARSKSEPPPPVRTQKAEREPARSASRRSDPAPKLAIREASARDAEGIAGLLAQMGPSPSPAAIRRTIPVLAKQGNPIILAERDGIIGCAAWQVLVMPQYPKPVGRITVLLVDKNARRQGVGAALLSRVEERIKKNGCEIVELVHDIELSSANSFLRQAGFVRSGYRFARDSKGSQDSR